MFSLFSWWRNRLACALLRQCEMFPYQIDIHMFKITLKGSYRRLCGTLFDTNKDPAWCTFSPKTKPGKVFVWVQKGTMQSPAGDLCPQAFNVKYKYRYRHFKWKIIRTSSDLKLQHIRRNAEKLNWSTQWHLNICITNWNTMPKRIFYPKDVIWP